MERKKTKLTISGNPKKSFDNIEQAKLKNKNSVVIEKKTSRFAGKSSFNRSTDQNKKIQKKSFSSSRQTGSFKLAVPVTNNFEKRKLAEQRATRRVKGELLSKNIKSKTGSKKREL